MKRKVRKVSRKYAARAEFDETEFLLLAFVTITLLVIVIWRGNWFPAFITNSTVLGISIIR